MNINDDDDDDDGSNDSNDNNQRLTDTHLHGFNMFFKPLPLSYPSNLYLYFLTYAIFRQYIK